MGFGDAVRVLTASYALAEIPRGPIAADGRSHGRRSAPAMIRHHQFSLLSTNRLDSPDISAIFASNYIKVSTL